MPTQMPTQQITCDSDDSEASYSSLGHILSING